MKTCPICGTQNEDSFSKCTICGADLPQTQTPVDEEKTTVLEPLDAAPSGLSLKADAPQQTMPQQQMPGMNMGMPQQQMPGMNMGMPQQQMPGMNPMPMQQAPVKSNKGVIFGVLAAIAVVLVVGLVLIFKGGLKVKGGVDSSDAVARTFIEAMDERDMDKMVTLCPPFLDPGEDDIQEGFDSVDDYDIHFKFDKVTNTETYSDSELKDLQARIKSDDNANVKLDAACQVDYDYTMSAEIMGEKYEEGDSDSVLAIKYKGKWFLYE